MILLLLGVNPAWGQQSLPFELVSYADVVLFNTKVLTAYPDGGQRLPKSCHRPAAKRLKKKLLVCGHNFLNRFNFSNRPGLSDVTHLQSAS